MQLQAIKTAIKALIDGNSQISPGLQIQLIKFIDSAQTSEALCAHLNDWLGLNAKPEIIQILRAALSLVKNLSTISPGSQPLKRRLALPTAAEPVSKHMRIGNSSDDESLGNLAWLPYEILFKILYRLDRLSLAGLMQTSRKIYYFVKGLPPLQLNILLDFNRPIYYKDNLERPLITYGPNNAFNLSGSWQYKLDERFNYIVDLILLNSKELLVLAAHSGSGRRHTLLKFNTLYPGPPLCQVELDKWCNKLISNPKQDNQFIMFFGDAIAVWKNNNKLQSICEIPIPIERFASWENVSKKAAFLDENTLLVLIASSKEIKLGQFSLLNYSFNWLWINKSSPDKKFTMRLKKLFILPAIVNSSFSPDRPALIVVAFDLHLIIFNMEGNIVKSLSLKSAMSVFRKKNGEIYVLHREGGHIIDANLGTSRLSFSAHLDRGIIAGLHVEREDGYMTTLFCTDRAEHYCFNHYNGRSTLVAQNFEPQERIQVRYLQLTEYHVLAIDRKVDLINIASCSSRSLLLPLDWHNGKHRQYKKGLVLPDGRYVLVLQNNFDNNNMLCFENHLPIREIVEYESDDSSSSAEESGPE